jgi:hypothetical protein
MQTAHRRVVQRDRPFVELGKIANDCQSQPRTGGGFVSAHSSLQHLIAHGERQAGTIVIHN